MLDLEFHVGRRSGFYEVSVLVPLFLVSACPASACPTSAPLLPVPAQRPCGSACSQLASIGWFSFFISRAAVPARVAISIIAFLSLTGARGEGDD